eukprot:5609215-Pleurochrysis_carterae.AAC.1
MAISHQYRYRVRTFTVLPSGRLFTFLISPRATALEIVAARRGPRSHTQFAVLVSHRMCTRGALVLRSLGFSSPLANGRRCPLAPSTP